MCVRNKSEGGKSQRIFEKVFKDWSMINNCMFNNLGRIWLVWRHGVKVLLFSKSSQLITISIKLEKEKVGDEFFFIM